MRSTLTNSSYRLTTTDFPIHSISSSDLEHEKLSKAFTYVYMVGVMVRSTFMLCHKASSPYNFNIQFPMYNKFIIHVYDFVLDTSMHQYCVISIAPPTRHRNSDKHPIYMTFMFLLPIIHYKMTCNLKVSTCSDSVADNQ